VHNDEVCRAETRTFKSFDCHLPDSIVSPTGDSAHVKTIMRFIPNNCTYICMWTDSQASRMRIWIHGDCEAVREV